MYLKILIICFIFLINFGCSISGIDYFEHYETKNIDKNNENSLDKYFDGNPQFVDLDILFVPYVRELAWKDDHRSFIDLYSGKIDSIWVNEVVISDVLEENSAFLKINKRISIDTLSNKDGMYSGHIPMIFGKYAVGDVDRILSSEVVLMKLFFKENKYSPLRKVIFKLKRKSQPVRALKDIISAA